MRRSAKGLSAVVIVLIAIVGVLLLGGLTLSGTYNSLVQLDATVEQEAADLDSQLKRRADLIPNLVSTVKGYAAQEKEIFTNVAEARSRLLNTNVQQNPEAAAQANSAVTGAIGRLLAIAENYPQLKSNENFIRLQDELAGTENRINYARLEFNQAVKQFNVKVRSFPTNIVAGMFGFDNKENFEATEDEKAVPKVEF